jgi:RimJ/RimL family protein N-acetyltransferase
MHPHPVTLIGTHVRLEPLGQTHAADLLAALASDPSIWRWMSGPARPDTAERMAAYVAAAGEAQARGGLVPFAQVAQDVGGAVGVTNYLNISPQDRGLEIGGTWLGRLWHRTGINTEAKYLLLRHAFEELGAARVQLKTDARNQAAQAAIARLGAVREGVLRRHMRIHDGFIRDTVMYSITEDEWPAVKVGLEALLAGRAGSAP